MARKRILDPKFWTDDKVMELPYIGRLLFIGMWNFSDDEGVHINNNKVLKAEIFPGDEITIEEIDQLKQLFINLELIILNKDQTLFKIKNWTLYQKISHPQPSKYVFITEEIPKDSVNTHLITPEQSRNTPESFLPNIIEYNIIEDNIKEPLVRKTKKSSKPVPYKDKVNKFFKELTKDEEYMTLLRESYPGLDVKQELKNARAWLLSNTDKAKSKFKAFCTRWMNKALEKKSMTNNQSSFNGTVNKQSEYKKYVPPTINEDELASSEEKNQILKDAVIQLRENKAERLKNVTNTKD